MDLTYDFDENATMRVICQQVRKYNETIILKLKENKIVDDLIRIIFVYFYGDPYYYMTVNLCTYSDFVRCVLAESNNWHIINFMHPQHMLDIVLGVIRIRLYNNKSNVMKNWNDYFESIEYMSNNHIHFLDYLLIHKPTSNNYARNYIGYLFPNVCTTKLFDQMCIILFGYYSNKTNNKLHVVDKIKIVINCVWQKT